MSVIPDHILYKMGPSLVDPFVAANVQPASIDLRLGNDFIVFDDYEGMYIDLGEPAITDQSRRVVKSHEDGFVLHPGEFVLGCTMERVTIPNNIVARLDGKSSIGRIGLMIHITAGFVDPGWEGRLTLEIYNVRRKPIILRPGRLFCQISFMQMYSPSAQSYQGRYQGADEVQPSLYGSEVTNNNNVKSFQLVK
jgi:dCTP deaminase